MTAAAYQYLREDGAKLSAWVVLAAAFAIVLGLTVFGLDHFSRSVVIHDDGRTAGSTLSVEDVSRSE